MRPISDLQRRVEPFQVISDYVPAGDQPAAIAEITKRINAGERDVVLLGATGTGKSATTAWLIEQLQRPTLVLAPNKTLAAQLANESSVNYYLTTRLNTLSRITTTTNLKRMFLKQIPLLRRTPALMKKLNDFATQRLTHCLPAEM